MMCGVIYFAGGVFAKHSDGLSLNRFESPDELYNDESAFNERVNIYNMNFKFQRHSNRIYFILEIPRSTTHISTKVAVGENIGQ